MSLTDWNGRTQYERNQGERDQEAAAADRDRVANIGQRTQDHLNNPGASMEIYGTPDQHEQTNANLSQVGAMTGQNIWQTGQQQQDYLASLQSRRNGDDAVAANMMAGRNRNMANVGRQFAGRGVAGGVAAAAMNSASNTADSQINAERQTNSKSNDQELWNYVKRNQKVEGEALAGGADQGLAQGMDTSQAGGIFGTVICTELYRQGLMDHETYLKDITFGMKLEKADPHAIKGYRMVAAPIVKLMKKSKVLTRIIAIPTLAWAENMAGKRNLAGQIIMSVGIFFCRKVYRLSTGYYFCPEVRDYV